MGEGLDDDDASNPAVEQVVRVVGNASQFEQDVVTASQQEESEHVHDGKVSGAVAEHLGNGHGAAPVDEDDAKGNVHAHVGGNVNGLQAVRQRANVDGRGELVLAVVTGPEERRVKQISLELSIVLVGGVKVTLVGIVQTGDSTDVASKGDADKPDGQGDGAGNPGVSKIGHDPEVVLQGLFESGHLLWGHVAPPAEELVLLFGRGQSGEAQ